METKQKLDYIESLKNSLGYNELVTVEPVGLSGGLVVMWKSSYKVEVLFSDKRIIDLKIQVGSMVFFLSCIYGDPVPAMRNLVWEHITSIGMEQDDAWVLVGDFNELLCNEEKLGGPPRADSSFWDFRNMVENCKLKEI
ncbi:hypothetical protein V5N11_003271 [Cardamine amara subsp. amara]|uniref:Endonuclease/exonuclease/phosphatase domain-containing protein n=1 Tax=Cardamine amara subsp. amara TaxID=228776 RepID=A0ABD1BTM6_CARAN